MAMRKPSKLVSQAKPVNQEKTDFRYSGVQECQREHAPRNYVTKRQEEHAHIYQRVDSGLSTTPLTNYHEMVNFPGYSPANLQNKTKASFTTTTKSAYQPLSPQLRTTTKNNHRKYDNQQEKNLYQKLQLKSEKSQSTSAMDENVERFADAAIPDYIEKISDEDFPNTRKAASHSQTLRGKNNSYEPLKPSTDSRIQQACK